MFQQGNLGYTGFFIPVLYFEETEASVTQKRPPRMLVIELAMRQPFFYSSQYFIQELCSTDLQKDLGKMLC